MTDRARGGVLLVDKPAGITSHDVVRRLRRALAERSVGHAGTLDPLATGLLVVLVGQSTRLAAHASDADKAYACCCQLGLSTDSDDVDGEVVARQSAAAIEDDAIERALATLRGEILQVPPAHSAVHVDGERAYARARRGEVVHVPARPVTVHRLLVEARRGDHLELAVEVSKGGYVRALVRDLGAALGCGATVTALRRLRAGHLHVDDAATLEALEQGDAWARVLPPGRLFEATRRLIVDAECAQALWTHAAAPSPPALPPGPAPWLAETADDVVGLVEHQGGALRLRRGFPAPRGLPRP